MAESSVCYRFAGAQDRARRALHRLARSFYLSLSRLPRSRHVLAAVWLYIHIYTRQLEKRRRNNQYIRRGGDRQTGKQVGTLLPVVCIGTYICACAERAAPSRGGGDSR